MVVTSDPVRNTMTLHHGANGPPVRSAKAMQKRAARVMVEQAVGRPMTNKAAKKWIKRQLARATR